MSEQELNENDAEMSVKDEESSKKEDVNASGGDDDESFEDGEEILAYHGNALYKAKIQKVKKQNGESSYFIHYHGWNKKWDEWVLGDRIMKASKQNLEYMKDLMSKLKSQKSESVSSSSNNNNASVGTKRKQSDAKPVLAKEKPASGSKKRSSITDDADEDSWDLVPHVMSPEAAKKQISIEIPPNLRRFISVEWENIMLQNKLIPLPRTPNVVTILDDYMKNKQTKKNPASDKMYKRLTNGLRNYFDRTLPQRLLYKNERLQYDEIMEANSSKTPSEIYGAEHLLRLFIKLPAMLLNTSLDEVRVSTLRQRLIEFVRYLQKHSSMFTTVYEPITAEYEKRSQARYGL